MPSLAPSALLILTLLAPSAAHAAQTETTVSVPIADGDPATVTGTLALHTRDGKQFLVLESPTPYRLLFPAASHTPPRIIRDISFSLPGQHAAIAAYAGRTVTATGRLHLEPKAAESNAAKSNAAESWNGALLESRIVLLPDGKELRARK